MWGQQGKTNRRLYTEQTQTANLGANATLLPFNQLRTVGYLRGINLYAPAYTGVLTLGTGGAFADVSAAQFNQLRQISNIDLINQGIAPIYQSISGLDLGLLTYLGNGKHPTQRRREAELGWNSAHANAATAGLYPYQWPNGGQLPQSSIPNVQSDQTTSTFVAGFGMSIPISEWLVFPNTAIGAAGNAVLVSDVPIEVGLLFMQSNAQVVSPFITAAALYGATYQNTVQVATAGSPTIVANGTSWQLEADFYDVPPNAADRPSGFQLGWAITRTAINRPVSSGNVTHVFANAGLLLRAAYYFFNDADSTWHNGTLSAPDPASQITLESGATVIKRQETGAQNWRRMIEQNGIMPPFGAFVHDLIGPNNIVTDALDTSNLVDPRVVMTGVGSSLTRMRVIEERALPLTVAA